MLRHHRMLLSEFCCSEKGELLTMRLKILCEDRCEDIAVNLAAACVRSLRRSDQLRSLSESHHVHYMIDVYIVLLYKLKRTQDIFAQVSINMGITLRFPSQYLFTYLHYTKMSASTLVGTFLDFFFQFSEHKIYSFRLLCQQ